MMNPELKLRYTSEAALAFCKEITQSENLDHKTLEQFANRTIENPEPTVERVLRTYVPRF